MNGPSDNERNSRPHCPHHLPPPSSASTDRSRGIVIGWSRPAAMRRKWWWRAGGVRLPHGRTWLRRGVQRRRGGPGQPAIPSSPSLPQTQPAPCHHRSEGFLVDGAAIEVHVAAVVVLRRPVGDDLERPASTEYTVGGRPLLGFLAGPRAPLLEEGVRDATAAVLRGRHSAVDVWKHRFGGGAGTLGNWNQPADASPCRWIELDL